MLFYFVATTLGAGWLAVSLFILGNVSEKINNNIRRNSQIDQFPDGNERLVIDFDSTLVVQGENPQLVGGERAFKRELVMVLAEGSCPTGGAGYTGRACWWRGGSLHATTISAEDRTEMREMKRGLNDRRQNCELIVDGIL